jgi:hypothetical protein
MDKSILDIVNDISAWRGNAYTLAQLVAAKQKELDAAAVETAGHPEAAEVLR